MWSLCAKSQLSGPKTVRASSGNTQTDGQMTTPTSIHALGKTTV